MIRQATVDDVQTAVEMGARFHAYSPWRDIPYDRTAMAGVMASLIEQGGLFLTDDGFIGGVVSPAYFSPSCVIATELFWYAPSGDGGLRQAFEDWARSKGAYGVQCSALSDEHLPAVTRIYRRAGYEQGEVCFLKRLN